MFKLLVSAVSSALLLSSVSATPIIKRDDVTCKFVTAAFLTLQTKLQQPGGIGGSDYIFVGLSDPDSNTGSRHLTTKDPSGGKSLNSNFAFYSCDSKFMGYETVEGNGDGAFGQNSITNYGHIALETKGHNPKHCLTYGSNPEDPTLISHDYCSFKDDESQIANFFSYVEHTTDAAVYLGGPKGEAKDYYITLSDDGVVHLNSGKAPEGTQEYFLGLPQFVD